VAGCCCGDDDGVVTAAAHDEVTMVSACGLARRNQRGEAPWHPGQGDVPPRMRGCTSAKGLACTLMNDYACTP
jgi:hypothetical protein